jgi:carbamoyl-phosphate synthase large subunit
MKLFIPGAGRKILHIKNFQEVPSVSSVIISDTDPWSFGNFIADAAYTVPIFKSSKFMNAVERIYEIEKFDVLIPIHDVALYVFSKDRNKYANLPFTLAINPKDTIDIVSDKLLTYEFFVKHEIPTEVLYTVEEFSLLQSYNFPYFLKPRYIHMRGSERQIYMKIDDEADMELILRKIKGNESQYVIQEFLSGDEINIDFFCDSEGTVQSIVPLRRLGMGISRGITRGEILFDERFDHFVHKTAKNLQFFGANQLQVYVTGEKNLKFTEINARFSGSSVLVKEAGVNYFEYFIRLLNGDEIEIRERPHYLKMCAWEKPHFFRKESAKHLMS